MCGLSGKVGKIEKTQPVLDAELLEAGDVADGSEISHLVVPVQRDQFAAQVFVVADVKAITS